MVMIIKPAHLQSRTNNKKLILQCIKNFQPISRAEIAEKLKISKPTVSIIVDELIQENWVYEKGIGESTSQGGRRPIHLYFNENAAYVIGTDIGGTKVRIIITNLNGEIICSSNFSTQRYLQCGLIKQLQKEVHYLIDNNHINHKMILGMGMGVPGITDPESGVVMEAPSLNWIRYPLLMEAEQYFSFPIYIDNDVNVAVLGEHWLGKAQNKQNVLFISVGTGIGSGIIINNQLYRGASNAAGEIGYMVTDKNAMKNEFKPIFHRYGFLESIAGGKAIGQKVTELIKENKSHPLYHQAQSSEISGEEAFTLAKNGDSIALTVIEEAIEHLAYGVINALTLLNPEVIILDGGVMKSGDFILPKLQQFIQRYVPSPVEIHVSQLGENAGVLGAVSLFLREYESLLN